MCFFFFLSHTDPTPVHLPGKSHGRRSLVGCSPWGRWESDTTEPDFTFTFHFHALEKDMATHSSVLAWRIPGTGEPGGLLSMGSHRVGHDWSDLAAAAVTLNAVNHPLLKVLPWSPWLCSFLPFLLPLCPLLVQLLGTSFPKLSFRSCFFQRSALNCLHLPYKFSLGHFIHTNL